MHLKTSEDAGKFVVYTGPSMNPTLKSGDKLQVVPYDGQRIQRGDVIAFISPSGDNKVIHRVITVDSQGIRTRGDNCSQVDPWLLKHHHILGRVVCVQRGKKHLRLYRGSLGQLYALGVRGILTFNSKLSSLFRPLYYKLAQSGIFRRWVHPRIKMQVLAFNRPAGKELQLVLGSRVIGRLLHGEDKWKIRRPFRLFVDEKSLPTSDNHRPNQAESRFQKSDKKIGENFNLIEQIRNIHQELQLSGEPKNSILNISDELLIYVTSLLRNELPRLPKVSMKQWLDFLSFLETHWIFPLLYRRAASLPAEVRPPELITHKMRMRYLSSSVRYLHMEKQLQEIFHAFQEKRVKVRVLRGPALAWSVYPDPALRPCSDLDLLVLPEQMIQARDVLESLNYKCLSQRFELVRNFFREEEFIHRTKPKDNFIVDLHWSNWEIHPFFGANGDSHLEELFQRAYPVKSSSLILETLDPVDALIHTAIHLAMIHSRDIRLIWISDIALLADQLHVPDDWQVLQKRSAAWRARLAVENSLKMAQLWFGLHLPTGFNDFSSWPQPSVDEKATWYHTIQSHWTTVLLKRYFSNPSGIFEMARSLSRLLFPPPDIVRYCYPPSRDWLLPLSYIRRWHRWFRELVVKRISSSRKKDES